jgi:hypothetical protein
MKKFLIIIMLFVSTIMYSQTITTNIVSSLNESKENVIFRNDVFNIKSTFIIWDAPETSTLYYITNYIKLADNKYIIYCNTNGKLINFTVDFTNNYIIINNKLLFTSSIKL